MLLDKINSDLIEAMKSKDKVRLDTIRLLKTALKNEEIKHEDNLTEEQEITIISREVKQRKESIKEFKNANRIDLIEKEEAQLKVLEKYLPKQLSNEELLLLINKICEKVNAANMKDMGKVMGALTNEVRGKADMSYVSKLVKETLINKNE